MSKDLPSEAKGSSLVCDAICDTGDRIMESALSCLRHSPYPELWNVTCQSCKGALILQGVVGSYFLKQLAYSTVSALKGIERIANQIEVQYVSDRRNDYRR